MIEGIGVGPSTRVGSARKGVEQECEAHRQCDGHDDHHQAADATTEGAYAYGAHGVHSSVVEAAATRRMRLRESRSRTTTARARRGTRSTTASPRAGTASTQPAARQRQSHGPRLQRVYAGPPPAPSLSAAMTRKRRFGVDSIPWAASDAFKTG